MAKITPPNWAKDAKLTTRGWVDAKTGELLKVQRFTQQDVDSYYRKSKPKTKEKPVVNEQVEVNDMQMLNEAPANHKSLEDMTKRELQALAEQRDVEFTSRDTKSVLLEKLS